MQTNSEPKGKDRPIYVWAAWASPLAAAAISIAFVLFTIGYQGTRGERPTAVLFFYLMLISASAVSGLVGIFALFGIRSWRDALIIIPGTLSGAGISGCNGVICFYAYALTGGNIGG